MSNYVIKNTETGLYVARSGSEHSYTGKLEHARTFETYEDANKDRCPGNERIVPIAELIK